MPYVGHISCVLLAAIVVLLFRPAHLSRTPSAEVPVEHDVVTT
jgi:hypothetical protein